MTKSISQIMAENQVDNLGRLQELRTTRQVVENLLTDNLRLTQQVHFHESLLHQITASRSLDEAKAIALQALNPQERKHAA